MRGLLGLLVCAGCAVEVADHVVEQEVDSANGKSLNGSLLNGTLINGTSLNGTTLGSVDVIGTSATGAPINTTVVPPGMAVQGPPPPLLGTTPIGSTWTGRTVLGFTVTLRIDSAQQGSTSDLWFYGVSYQTIAGWFPLCGGDLAVPVAGVWSITGAYSASSTGFTFACRNRSIAKCVEMGYKTWLGRSAQLASCVRLLRGDYCGNGIPYTIDGTLLNLYDNIGVQLDTEAWTPEAEWTPAGAKCISSRGLARFQLAGFSSPPCPITVSAKCGKSFSNATVLIDELP
jgi:hypothetical protein